MIVNFDVPENTDELRWKEYMRQSGGDKLVDMLETTEVVTEAKDDILEGLFDVLDGIPQEIPWWVIQRRMVQEMLQDIEQGELQQRLVEKILLEHQEVQKDLQFLKNLRTNSSLMGEVYAYLKQNREMYHLANTLILRLTDSASMLEQAAKDLTPVALPNLKAALQRYIMALDVSAQELRTLRGSRECHQEEWVAYNHLTCLSSHTDHLAALKQIMELLLNTLN